MSKEIRLAIGYPEIEDNIHESEHIQQVLNSECYVHYDIWLGEMGYMCLVVGDKDLKIGNSERLYLQFKGVQLIANHIETESPLDNSTTTISGDAWLKEIDEFYNEDISEWARGTTSVTCKYVEHDSDVTSVARFFTKEIYFTTEDYPDVTFKIAYI